ncbi:hypothetical protein GCM10011588_43350 [Nocardia jinanensis]|uniref:Uncharacterized protein n=1 Tax=Nocardia jinanensis TaxID=382504 RepID=A0A917VWV6_9NOCA|nr:hypothetical protein GCM10011588_43350 [Nocardia jinanensis]
MAAATAPAPSEYHTEWLNASTIQTMVAAKRIPVTTIRRGNIRNNQNSGSRKVS